MQIKTERRLVSVVGVVKTKTTYPPLKNLRFVLEKYHFLFLFFFFIIIMLARIIFLSAVAAAILVVLLLTLFSPVPENNPSESLISFSLYVQQPRARSSPFSRPYHHRPHHKQMVSSPRGGALIFHRALTEGPENTSRVVGKAQGFIIPQEEFARSDFNVIYLTFETGTEYKGSVSVRAREMEHKDEEVLDIVGGTGAFAFARGIAVFAVLGSEDSVTTYRLKLMLRFPDRSHTVRTVDLL
ncbi:PREDICTED: dirigent protein 11 [Tarenaya hassleriana]|uniref:dirigent protein 11 n=1 Tax=Tarenaya hassleriana TaxID=28532 RepID=UPI0008FD5294|nr:PREDICTED: dirigent protein 11 [Tarenaya hassleriana]